MSIDTNGKCVLDYNNGDYYTTDKFSCTKNKTYQVKNKDGVSIPVTCPGSYENLKTNDKINCSFSPDIPWILILSIFSGISIITIIILIYFLVKKRKISK